MKIIRLISLALFLSAAATGCIELDADLIINDNGSGLATFEWSIAENSIAQIKSMDTLAANLAAQAGKELKKNDVDKFIDLLIDPSSATLRTALEEFQPLGIKIEELEVKTADGKRKSMVKLRFDDISKLQGVTGFEKYGFKLTLKENGDYVFLREADKPMIPKGINLQSEEIREDLADYFRGFDLKFSLTVPGTIKTHNGHKKSGKDNCSWRYSFSETPAAFTLYQNHTMQVIFHSWDADIPEIP